jgi:hypothetical protein
LFSRKAYKWIRNKHVTKEEKKGTNDTTKGKKEK